MTRALATPLGKPTARGAGIPLGSPVQLPGIIAPLSGAGMGAECAGGPIYGTQGEAITVVRATTKLGTRSDGVLVEIPANQPCVMVAPGGYLGILVERACTNLCLHSNDLTQAEWVKVNMVAAKTATGPDNVANSASTITAQAANATILQTITVASASRSTSVYVKRRTGVGVIEITRNNGSTWTAITASVGATWTRVSQAGFSALSATAANPIVGIRIVTSGDAVDIAYFQDEAGPNSTSPVLTGAASATRDKDSITMANPLFGNTSTTWVIRFTGIPYDGVWGKASFVRRAIGTVTSSPRFFLYVSASTARPVFEVNDGALTKSFQTTNGINALAAGAHTVQGTNSAGTLTVSIDGGANEVGGITGSGTGIILAQPASIIIGSSGSNDGFDGLIYNISIDDRSPSRGP